MIPNSRIMKCMRLFDIARLIRKILTKQTAKMAANVTRLETNEIRRDIFQDLGLRTKNDTPSTDFEESNSRICIQVHQQKVNHFRLYVKINHKLIPLLIRLI